MFGLNRPSVCALAALFAYLMIASQADAGCFKNLFGHSKCSQNNGRDKSYEQFANDLYELTQSKEPKDIANATGSLFRRSLSEKKSKSYGDLIYTLEMQTNTQTDHLLCGSSKSLRYLAEMMAVNGNLEPKKTTEPIRHLNRIIIAQIVRAREVCFGYMARAWFNPWLVPKEWPSVYERLCMLDSLPHSVLLDNLSTFKTKEIEEVESLSLSCMLVEGRKEKRILSPYADFLIASHIVEPESGKLAKFYRNAQEQPVLAPVDHPNQELLTNAYRFRACDLLAAKDKK